jgi:integrase
MLYTLYRTNTEQGEQEKMKIHLTQSYVSSLKPNPDKPIWITDDEIKNLKLYVGTSGAKVWYLYYYGSDGKKASKKLGSADKLTVAQARMLAQDVGGRVIRGENVKKEKPAPKFTYGDFLKNYYERWVVDNRKSGRETMRSINAAFGWLMPQPLEDLSIIELEQWRTKRMREGNKAATINRLVVALKASVNWAVSHELIKENPLARLGRLKERDSSVKVRYLSDDERVRLMAALDNREERIRSGRESHNEWSLKRKKEAFPEFSEKFVDYLKPMVLVSLNSGLRRGSLFGLKWGDIDFFTRTMTIRPDNDKPEKTLQLPMNAIVNETLAAWKGQNSPSGDDALVFPSPVSGGELNNVKKSWATVLKEAGIENFRWHDMRHDFASQLVMKGVDLNTVRELMGHADMKMTMRYAHLAPSSKLRAVEVLAENNHDKAKDEASAF